MFEIIETHCCKFSLTFPPVECRRFSVFQHPLIVPLDEVSANENGTLVVYRFSSKGSLKDHLHQTKPINGPYWKRYGPKSLTRGCDANQIKILGRLILEALNFIYDNGLTYGHLHSGNLLFDLEQAYPVKLLDVSNVISGVSSKYRCYISHLKDIHVILYLITFITPTVSSL